jgi:hypothetical protein
MTMCRRLANRVERLSVKLRADTVISNAPRAAVSPTRAKEPMGPCSSIATASGETTTSMEASSTKQVATEVHCGRRQGTCACSSIDARLKPSEPVEKKHVSFATLEFREYDIILGDHPDCSEGPPVSIFNVYLVHRGCNVCLSSCTH